MLSACEQVGERLQAEANLWVKHFEELVTSTELPGNHIQKGTCLGSTVRCKVYDGWIASEAATWQKVLIKVRHKL